MSPNPDTIARLLNQAGLHIKTAIALQESSLEPGIDAAMHCIHQAIQEAIGGAAYARPEPAEGPWVVSGMLGKTRHYSLGPDDEGATEHLSVAYRFANRDEAEVDATAWTWADPVTVLPLAEAQRMEAAAAQLEPSPQPAAPAAVAGWVVRGVDGATLLHTWSPDGDFDDRSRPHVFCDRDEAEKDAEHWRHAIGRRYPVVVLPVDAAGNVLEERAPAPDVVAQCRAAEPTPAPREPDGWVVVDDRGWCEGTWTRSEVTDPERCAKQFAEVSGPGYTARPFWLDTPPASDEAATLRAEVERLRAALRAIAMTVGASVGEQATTDLHCAVADEVRLVVERLTRERDEARLGGVCHALGCMVRAYELDGVTASKLAEMLGWRVGDLHGSGLQAVANMIFEAATELPQALALARQCRDVALGERERIAIQFARGSDTERMVRAMSAPALPEVP